MAGVNQETDQSQATFKQQLDRAATDTRSQDANNINPIVEKGTHRHQLQWAWAKVKWLMALQLSSMFRPQPRCSV
jgi:hypothetical protein